MGLWREGRGPQVPAAFTPPPNPLPRLASRGLPRTCQLLSLPYRGGGRRLREGGTGAATLGHLLQKDYSTIEGPFPGPGSFLILRDFPAPGIDFRLLPDGLTGGRGAQIPK